MREKIDMKLHDLGAVAGASSFPCEDIVVVLAVVSLAVEQWGMFLNDRRK